MKSLTVNYKKLGKQKMKLEGFSVHLMMGENWKVEPHAFGFNTEGKDLPPIDCELQSKSEYLILSRALVPRLATIQGTAKRIYTCRGKTAWFVFEVTDIDGKKWQTIAGWTRTIIRVGDDGVARATVCLSRPSAMARCPDEVDHYDIEVPLSEVADVETTLLMYDGIVPSTNPNVRKD